MAATQIRLAYHVTQPATNVLDQLRLNVLIVEMNRFISTLPRKNVCFAIKLVNLV